MVQKLFTASGVLIALGLILFVHPPEQKETSGTVLELWHTTGADESEFQPALWFNESHDEFQVKAVALPFLQIEQKFLTSMVGGIPPDVFIYFGSVAQWSSRGALLPLDKYMDRDGFDRSKIFDSVWPEMMWNNETFAIPVGVGVDAFYWNKEHFLEAGLDPDRPPRTWEELEDYAVRLTKKNAEGRIEQAGYIPGYWSPFATPLFLYWPLQLGAKFLSEDGRKVNLTSNACVEALEWETSMFEKIGREALIEKRASFGYGTQHGFLSGQLSMIEQKSSFVEEIRKFAPDLEYGCAQFPIPEGGKRATTLGPVWVGIPRGARHPDEAWEFIKFFTSDETQLHAAKYSIEHNEVGFFPANIEVARSPVQMTVPCMDIFLESMDNAYSPTVVPLAHVTFWREYGKAWDLAIRGIKSPREALEDAQREIQKALDSQIEYDRFYRNYLTEREEGRG
ncbi:MAG: ABC transporter substrate-binding protein [Candidatus Omnitrophica bacterium]|nr:ABC transporter substrate-binding protein [Candidatus Omnitrophota bacterium]